MIFIILESRRDMNEKIGSTTIINGAYKDVGWGGKRGEGD